MAQPHASSTRSEATIVCGCRATNTEDDLAALIRHGAGEIFAGYVPRAWLETFGMEVSPNRRYRVSDQVTDRDQLRRFAQTAREHGAGFVLALNEHYYPPEAHVLIDEIVATGLDVGATGFIVADLAMLARLQAGLAGRAELIVSQEAGIDSAASARVFVEHGGARLIFARETLLSEMRAMTAAFGSAGPAFEAFVAREFCTNSSSRCFVCHGYGSDSYFCVATTGRRLIARRGTGEDLELATLPPGYSYDPSFQRAFRTLHRCGLCAVDELLDMGVRYLKVPGRSSFAIDALVLLQRLLASRDRSVEACRRLVDSDVFCSGDYCYYALGPAPARRRDAPMRPRAPAAAVLVSDGTPSGSPVEDASGDGQPPELEIYLSTGSFSEKLVDRLTADGLRPATEQYDGFFAAWERDRALGCLDALEALGLDPGRPPARVQLGLELCALRLPGPGSLAAEIMLLQAAGFPVSVVLPVAYEAIWEALLEIVDTAVEVGDDGLELVVNDLGLLGLAAGRWPARLATGRLFNRMKRDQLEKDDAIVPAAAGVLPESGLSETEARDRLLALRGTQQAMYGYPYLSEPFYRRHLAGSRVSSVGLDLLPTPLSGRLAPDFTHVLYLPWTCVATTRACPVAGAVAGSSVAHPTQSCARPCRDKLLAYDYPFRHRRTVQRGAGIFLDCTDALSRFLASARPSIQRLVFEPAVPW